MVDDQALYSYYNIDKNTAQYLLFQIAHYMAPLPDSAREAYRYDGRWNAYFRAYAQKNYADIKLLRNRANDTTFGIVIERQSLPSNTNFHARGIRCGFRPTGSMHQFQELFVTIGFDDRSMAEKAGLFYLAQAIQGKNLAQWHYASGLPNAWLQLPSPDTIYFTQYLKWLPVGTP